MHELFHLENLKETSFFFVRHGQTDWNKEGRIMGHQDIPLNEKGRAQARNLQNMTKTYQINQIFYSPLSRTQETAKILNMNSNITMLPLSDLKEWGWGEIEGVIPEKCQGEKPKYLGKTLSQWVQTPQVIQAEPEDTFSNRIRNALTTILLYEGTSLVVSHGGVFKALCKLLDCDYNHLDNCTPMSFSSFKVPGNPNLKWKILHLGN